MERFERGHESFENSIERDDIEWCFEKKDGEWTSVGLPKLSAFDPNDFEEKNRRRDNFLLMMKETSEKWDLRNEEKKHNEGILRDHERYHDLFLKWAMRYWRMKGINKSKYTGEIEEDEGAMLRSDGERASTRLVNFVANGREWIDEKIGLELLISEGFVDITNDEERQNELGIEPQHEGWWTQDEI